MNPLSINNLAQVLTAQRFERIVCLTEETTETIYALGEQHRIVGISGFTVRPAQARHEKPRVSAYTSANTQKILDLQPDLIFAFSDMQADICATLVKAGLQVHVFNHRSISGIFDMILTVGRLLDTAGKASQYVGDLIESMRSVEQSAATLTRRPRVYFEEWDEPRISAIRWVSELIEVAGGIPCFPDLALQSLGKDRIIPDDRMIWERQPDIIIGSWCGKKFRPEHVMNRPGWQEVPAVQNRQLFEIKSPLILQPGPAALTDGLAQLHHIIKTWAQAQE